MLFFPSFFFLLFFRVSTSSSSNDEQEIGNISIDIQLEQLKIGRKWKELNELCWQPIIKPWPNAHILIFQLIFRLVCRWNASWMVRLTRGSGVFDNIDTHSNGTTTTTKRNEKWLCILNEPISMCFCGYLLSVLASLWAKCTCKSIYIYMLRTKSIVCGFCVFFCAV